MKLQLQRNKTYHAELHKKQKGMRLKQIGAPTMVADVRTTEIECLYDDFREEIDQRIDLDEEIKKTVAVVRSILR